MDGFLPLAGFPLYFTKYQIVYIWKFFLFGIHFYTSRRTFWTVYAKRSKIEAVFLY